MGSRRSRKLGFLLLAMPLLLIPFQNCQKSMTFEGSAALSEKSVDVAPLACGLHASGASWEEVLDGAETVPASCPFGGTLAHSFKKTQSLTCVDGIVAAVGEPSRGEMIGTSGTCLVPTCGSHENQSTWQIPEGEIRTASSCPDSALTTTEVVQKLIEYKCDNGQTVALGSSAGAHIGQEGACPQASVSASFAANTAAHGSLANLIVKAENVRSVSFACDNGVNATLALGSSSTPVLVKQDLNCIVTATTSLGNHLTAPAKISVQCNADQVVSGNSCVEFVCRSYEELKVFPAQIKARGADGVCYYTKLMDSVATARSSGEKNANVLARNHDSGAATANPYIMGQATRQFTLLGARAVKLSGSSNSTASILVDNFVLLGQRQAADAVSKNAWSAYGTSDSSLPNSSVITAYGKSVPVQAFASGGTATVKALLLTSSFAPMIENILDVHALDCGGSKALSSIYLVFQ